jgi:hypothetical protein
MKNLLILMSSIFTINSYACQCVTGFLNQVYYEKEDRISEHFKINKTQINSILEVSSKERNTVLHTSANIVLFPLAIGFYLTAGECERSCMSAGKQVGVVKYQVDYTNTEGKRCDALIKIKGKVNFYGEGFKRFKVKTLTKACEV